MNSRYLIAAGAFLAALVAGGVFADALTSEEVPPVIPDVTNEVVPVVPLTPVALPDLPSLNDPALPSRAVEVAAELRPVEGGGGGVDPDFGEPDEPPDGAAAPGDPVPPGGGGEPPPDPGFDFTIETNLFVDLMVELPDDDPVYRFFDFCADADDEADCPVGIGATVLIDYDGPGEPGTFEIAETLYATRSGWWRCAETERLRPGEYLLMVVANQPSRMEISWHPADEPTEVSSTVVDTSVVSSPELGRWLELMTTTGGPATGQGRPQHCFVLDGGRASRRLVVTATATSITGETDTESFTFTTSENRRRPPVTVAPRSDYNATVAMPVPGDGFHSTILRVITQGEGLGCSDIERAAVFDGTRYEVLTPEPGHSPGRWSGWTGAEEMGEIVNSDDWPYDPAYDTYNFWDLHLAEGRAYLVCMWWVRSPSRSFDEATVVDRESRWLITPDRTTTRIRVASVRAASGGLTAGAIEVWGGCLGIELPSVELGPNEVLTVPVAEGVICDFGGYEQPDLTTVNVRTAGGDMFAFAVPTPNDAPPGTEYVDVVLDVERAAGLCGSSFGPCDPPTTVYPGPKLTLVVENTAGGTTGRDDWQIRAPYGFDAPETAPRELPAVPQLDHFGSAAVGETRDRIRLTAGFDRPVRLVATLQGAPEDPCVGGGVLTMAAEDLAPVHTLVFTGLCTLSEYVVDLEATDESGATVRYVASSAADGIPWRGWTNTRGWPVRYFVGVNSGFVDDIFVGELHVSLAGTTGLSVSLRPESNCLVTTQSREQVAEWRDTITVRVEVVVALGEEVDGFCRGWSLGAWRGSVMAEVTIDDLRAGTVFIPVPLTDSSGRSVGSLQIRISGTVGF